ncbi:hypothetical protein PENSPDRAFT_456275 [Peniophora sp. CONT]|nr:hypothetical protein PENSPDRAFT_456275 [Peniophora sp. CONT]
MPNAALLAPRRLRTAIARFTPRPLLTITRGRPSRVIDATAVGSMPLALTVTDPIIVASSVDATSARSPLHRVKASGAIAKDALLLSLEGLAQSADAFPPLKSAVGGLLFIVTQIELVSNNKGQIHDIYVQIDGFAESLVRAVPDITLLSPAAKEAIFALAK